MNLQLQPIAMSVALLLTLRLSTAASPAQLNEARVTAVSKNVTVLSPQSRARSAALNDRVTDNAIVRTGDQSHAELTFTNQSVARLWARTIINVRDGARNLYLQDGAVFLQVPKGAEVTSIRAADVAAEISGGSVVFQVHPKVFKFLVLEGTARLYHPDQVGDSVLVSSGQLVFGTPKANLSDPVDFDISHFLKTSRFITEFAPLRGGASMASEIQKQQQEKSNKTLIETNLVMYGGGTTVSVVGPGKTGTGSRASAKSPHRLHPKSPSPDLVNRSR